LEKTRFMVTPVDLDPDNREFVDAVMVPLGSAALQRELLEEALAIAATVPRPDASGEIGTASKRMRSLSKGFRFRAAISLLALVGVFTAVAWAAVLGSPALRSLDEVLLANRMSNAVGSMCCSHKGVPRFPWFDRLFDSDREFPSEIRVLESMPPDNRLRCTGDYLKTDAVERWKAVHDRYPQDPAHYFAYALVHRRVSSAWPEDFLKNGEELDPDNGWFRFLAGVEMAKSALGAPPRPRITKEERLAARAKGTTLMRLDPGPDKRVEILDPERLRKAYDLIDQALQKPRLDDYRATLNRIRFEASPASSDFARHSFRHVLAVTQPEDGSSDWASLRDLGISFSLTAKDAARRRDADTLLSLQQRARLLGSRLPETASLLISQLMVRQFLKTACGDLADGWAVMGDPSEAGRLIAIAGTISHKSPSSGSRPPDALSEHRGSGFLAQMEGFSRHESSVPVTESELRGGRLAEYAMYERFMAHAVAFILFIALAFAFIRAAFEKKSLGLLPERFLGLLTLSDRIRILLLGVVLPFAFYLASTRITWLDPREFALDETRFFLWLAQSLALALSVTLISLDTANRCLNRRALMLALRWRSRDHSWIFGWVALLSMPAASVMARFDPGNDLQELMFWSSVAFMVGTPFLYLCNLVAFIFGGSPARKLHRAILLRTIAMPLTLASWLVAASIPLLRAEERFWVARIGFDALHPDDNIFAPKPEMEYAVWLGKEVRRAADEMAK
jgi:hypothetical protein